MSRINRFSSFPIRIGRSYQNDLIVQDPYISPEHLRVSEDEGQFVIEDLESENGFYINRRRGAEKRVYVVSGDNITIGNTNLRFVVPSHPVVPARRLGLWSKPVIRILFYALAWISLLPTLGCLIYQEYLFTFKEVRLSKLISEIVPIMILPFFWAGLWSLVGYLAIRRTRFHAQLFASNIFIVGVSYFFIFAGYLAFAFNVSTLMYTIGCYVGIGIWLAFLVFYNLGYATAIKRKKRVIASFLPAAVLVLLFFIIDFADKPDFNANPEFSTLLKPPYAKLVPSQSIDEFLKDGTYVFAKSREKGRND